MSKTFYQKPKIKIYLIELEEAIAEGSLYVGPNINDNVPEVDDFIIDGTDINGLGDI